MHCPFLVLQLAYGRSWEFSASQWVNSYTKFPLTHVYLYIQLALSLWRTLTSALPDISEGFFPFSKNLLPGDGSPQLCRKILWSLNMTVLQHRNTVVCIAAKKEKSPQRLILPTFIVVRFTNSNVQKDHLTGFLKYRVPGPSTREWDFIKLIKRSKGINF